MDDVWVIEVCPHCKSKNWIFLVCQSSTVGFKCWKCRKFTLQVKVDWDKIDIDNFASGVSGPKEYA